MARPKLLLLCCLCFVVPVIGQGSSPRCFTVSEVSCTFQSSLCGWESRGRSNENKWIIQEGKAVLDTAWNWVGNTDRRAVLTSPVICGPQDCRTLSLEFHYGFSKSGGGRLFVEFLGVNTTFRVVAIEENTGTTHHFQNITLGEKGHFQISIAGDIDKDKIYGSDIYLYKLCLRYIECGTTTGTSDRQGTTKSVDTANCSEYTGVTSTQTSRTTTIATEGDDSEAGSVDSAFNPKKDDGGDKRSQSTVIISACVGSGLVLAGIVVTVVVISRRRSGPNGETVAGGRTAGARHSSLMMENELYLSMAHTADPASGDTTRANGRTMEMIEMQPSGPSTMMSLVTAHASSNYYSTLGEDEITHSQTTAAETMADARETTPNYSFPNIKRLPVVSPNIAQKQDPLKRELSPGDCGLSEILAEQCGNGEPAAADHEYDNVKEEGKPDDHGDNYDHLRPEDHYDLIHDSPKELHVYNNEASSFDGASVMTLRSQDNVLASQALGGHDEPQQENVYDAIASG